MPKERPPKLETVSTVSALPQRPEGVLRVAERIQRHVDKGEIASVAVAMITKDGAVITDFSSPHDKFQTIGSIEFLKARVMHGLLVDEEDGR